MKEIKKTINIYSSVGDIVFYVRDKQIYMCCVEDIQLKEDVWYIVRNVTGEVDSLNENNFKEYCFKSEDEAKLSMR